MVDSASGSDPGPDDEDADAHAGPDTHDRPAPESGTEQAKANGGVAAESWLPADVPRVVAGAVPLILLGVIVGTFLVFAPLGGLGGGEPLPDLSIDYTTIPDDDTLRLHVTNNGPPVEITQVMVDEAFYRFDVESPGDDATLGRRESATVDVSYHWTKGYDYEVTLMTDGPTFSTTIVAAHRTPALDGAVLGTLALVGFLVGIVPVALGMLWFPFMQSMSRRWLHAVLAFSAGVLAFLIFDAGFEALDVAKRVPTVYAGPVLAVLGGLGALVLVQSVMDWQTGDEPSSLALAYAAALGIGLHNFAEGLAIGGAFALGRASLGAFLVVGFMIHNVTEGPVVVAPLADGERPPLAQFVAIGALAGAPAILGGWVGNAFRSPILVTLFLAVGVGALLQVVFDIGGMIHRNGTLRSATNLVAFFLGLVVMYATDLLVAI